MFEVLFSRSGLSLDRLRALCQVADAGGIARAVGSDPVRQSLVSRQLKELEAFFERELTLRQGKSLALTPAGEELARLAREHLAALDDFAGAGRGLDARFSLGAGDSILHWRVLPRLAAARRAFPQLVLELHALGPGKVVDELRDLALDFGIVRSTREHRRLASERLGRVEYALYVPRALLAPREKADARRLLVELPLAVPHGDEVFTRWLEALALGKEVVPSVALSCETFPQACSALVGGGYAAILPTFVRSELRGRAVVEVKAPLFADLASDAHLVWNPRVLRVRAAAERARDALARAISW
jgi:DNA-binding transcriptional LysR family regulator